MNDGGRTCPASGLVPGPNLPARGPAWQAGPDWGGSVSAVAEPLSLALIALVVWRCCCSPLPRRVDKADRENA